MNDYPGGSGLSGERTDFTHLHALNNAAVVGAYLRLVADGATELAEAWLGCHAAWGRGEAPFGQGRPVQILSLTPTSSSAYRLLEAYRSQVQDAIQQFTGDVVSDPAQSSTVWLKVNPPMRPTAEEWKEDFLETIDRATVNGGDAGKADLFRRIIRDSIIGVTHCYGQRLFQFAIPDCTVDQAAELQDVINWADEYFFSHGESPSLGRLNNWSIVTPAAGPKLIADASVANAVSAKAIRVGLILPGGNKARSDILDLEEHPAISPDIRIVPRGESDLGQRMAEAISQLSG